jgi:HEAT repeat protein
MRVLCNAVAFGMAVVLLDTACSGRPEVVVKDLVGGDPPGANLSCGLADLGDRSGMETLRNLLFGGEPEDVRAEAAIAPGELGAIDKLKGLKAA